MNGESQHHTRVSLFAPQSFTETVSLIESLPTTQKLHKVDGDRGALMNIPATTVTLFIKSIGFTEALTREFIHTVLQSGACSKIKSLYLLDCEFSSLVTLLKPFQRVQNLSITASKIKNFAELPLLPNVISLHLDGNLISSWAHFPDAPKLAFLSLNYNKLEGFAQFPTTKLKNLEIFSAVGNSFECILPSPELELETDALLDCDEDSTVVCDEAFCVAMSVLSLFLQGGRINSINSLGAIDIMTRYSALLAARGDGNLVPTDPAPLKQLTPESMLSSHKLLEQRMSAEDAFLVGVDNTLPYRVIHGLTNWVPDEGIEYLQRSNMATTSLQFRTYCSRFLHRKSISIPILRASFALVEGQEGGSETKDVYVENSQCSFHISLLSTKHKLVEVLFYHTCFGCAPQLMHGVNQQSHHGSEQPRHASECGDRHTSGSYAATNGGYARSTESEARSTSYTFTFTLPPSFLSNTHVVVLIKLEERTAHAQRTAGSAFKYGGTQLERNSHNNALASILQDNLGTRTLMTNIRSTQTVIHIASPPIQSCKPTICSANFLLSSKELQVGSLVSLRYSYSGGEEGATIVTWYRCTNICSACQDIYESMTTSQSGVSDLPADQCSISQSMANCKCTLEQLKQGRATESSSICEYTPTLTDANMFLRADIMPVSYRGTVGERFVLLSTRVVVKEEQIIKTCTLEKVDTSHALLNIASLVPVDLEIYWYQKLPSGERILIPEYDNDRVFDLKSSIIEQYRLYGSVIIVCEAMFYPVPLTDAERYSNDSAATSSVPLLKKILETEFYVNTMRRSTASRTPRTRSVSSKHDGRVGNSHYCATPMRSTSKENYSEDHHPKVAHTSEFASQKVPFRSSYFDRGKSSPLWQIITIQNDQPQPGPEADAASGGYFDNELGVPHTASVTALNPIKKSARFSDEQEPDLKHDSLAQIASQLQSAVHSGNQASRCNSSTGKSLVDKGGAPDMQLSNVPLEISQPANVLTVFQSQAPRSSRLLINAYNDSKTDTNSWDLSEEDINKNVIASRQRLSRMDQSRASEVPKSLVLQESNYTNSFTVLQGSATQTVSRPVEQKQDRICFEFPSSCVEMCSVELDNSANTQNASNNDLVTQERNVEDDTIDDRILTSKGALSPIIVMATTAVHQDGKSKQSRADSRHMTSSTVELMDTAHITVTTHAPVANGNSARNDNSTGTGTGPAITTTATTATAERPDRRWSNRNMNNITSSEPSEPSRASERMSISESIPEIAISPQPLDLNGGAREIEIPVDPENLYSDMAEDTGIFADSVAISTRTNVHLTNVNVAPLEEYPSEGSGIEMARDPEQSHKGPHQTTSASASNGIGSASQSLSHSLDPKRGYVVEQLVSTLMGAEPTLKQLDGLSIGSSLPSYRGSSASETVKNNRAFENETSFKNNTIGVRITREAHMVGDVLGIEVYGAVDQSMNVFIVRSYVEGIFFESSLIQLVPVKCIDYCQMYMYRVTPFDLGSSLRVIVRALGSFGAENLVDRLLDATVIGAAETDISLLMWRRVCEDRVYKVESDCREEATSKQGMATMFYNDKLFGFKFNKRLVYTCKDMRRLAYEVEFHPCLSAKELRFTIKGQRPVVYSLVFQRIEDLGFVYYRLLLTAGLSLLYH